MAVVLAALTWALQKWASSGVVNALDVLVGIIGVIVTLLAWRLPLEHSKWAGNQSAAIEELARQISTVENAALNQLLGESGAPRPANVTFGRLALIRWRTDGSGERGDLDQIGDYFRNLRLGRLIVLGEPGSGKTVLAARLVQELLRARPGAAFGAAAPVPVRFSLSSFNPLPGGESLDALSDQELSRRLDAWLAAQLLDHNVPRRQAIKLIRDKRVLPVLDGLDEMDLDNTPPRNAAAVIRALNATPRPFVLTSRRHRHDQLLQRQATGTAPSAAQLPTASSGPQWDGRTVPTSALPRAYSVQDATTVLLDPLQPTVVRDYLIYLFPDPSRPDGIAPHWRATAFALDHAARHGAATRWTEPLVTALCSPWQLYLCRTAFADPHHGDPHRQLSGLAPDQLTGELMRRLIPVAVEHHPRRNGRRYDPEKVTTWLATLADHLHKNSHLGASSSDILLHELWPAAGRRVPRYLGAMLLALSIVPLIFLSVSVDKETGATGGAVAGVLATVAGLLAMRKPVRLARLDLKGLTFRRRHRRFARRPTGALLAGLAVVLTYMLISLFADFAEDQPFQPDDILFGGIIGLGFGVTTALTFGLMARVAQTPSMISSPSQLVRQGLLYDLGKTLMVGLGFGLTLLLANGGVDSASAYAFGLGLGLAFGIMIGLAFGFTTGTSPWPRYLVTVLMLRRRKALPLRLARFLDWAYDAGLVRMSGIAVQFRHDTFRIWLAQGGATGSTAAARTGRPRQHAGQRGRR